MGLINERARVLSNKKVGPNLYIIRLDAPGIAARVEPGQFVHMKVPGMEAHILRRPFSVYKREEKDGVLWLLYQAVGFGTEHMASLGEGAPCELVGPVGHGWQPPEDARRVLLVGGGVGAAPLYLLAQRLCNAGVRVDALLGAQTKDALVCLSEYASLHACMPVCSTDDGSYGRAGFVTSLVEEALAGTLFDPELEKKSPVARATTSELRYDYAAVCGPEPMMRIVAPLIVEAGVPCEVSLEKRMACGVGACLSCVVETVDGKRRACVDGPVFDARKVVW